MSLIIHTDHRVFKVCLRGSGMHSTWIYLPFLLWRGFVCLWFIVRRENASGLVKLLRCFPSLHSEYVFLRNLNFETKYDVFRVIQMWKVLFWLFVLLSWLDHNVQQYVQRSKTRRVKNLMKSLTLIQCVRWRHSNMPILIFSNNCHTLKQWIHSCFDCLE